MHICGFSGSGKTTLGNTLKTIFGDKIIVQDLDNFLVENYELTCTERRQQVEANIKKYIDTLGNDKKIILVGTGCINTVDEEFIDIDVLHRIWLDVSAAQSSRQGILRQLEWMYNNKEEIVDGMVSSNLEDVNDYLNAYCNYHTRILHWNPLYNVCKNRKYRDITEKDIIDIVRNSLK